MTDILKGWFCDHSPGRGKIMVAGGGGGGGSGGYYFEATMTSSTDHAKSFIGIANSAAVIANAMVYQSLSAGAYPAGHPGTFESSTGLDGCAFLSVSGESAGISGWSGGTQAPPPPTGFVFANGHILGVAVNTTTGLAWWRDVTEDAGTPNWSNPTGSGTADPATGTKGYALSQAAIGATDNLYVLVGAGWETFTPDTAPVATINFGATSFTGVIPTGFSAWDTTGTTIINPSDKSSYVILSGGNLTWTISPELSFSAGGGFFQGARSTTAKPQ